MENKELKERDFHHGEGHHFPFFLKIAWTILICWGIYYLFTYSLPDLKDWVN
jgi:hypothetical protein